MITSALNFFKVRSPANQPTLQPGRIFFTSKLKRPKRFDLICYRILLPEIGMTRQTHRLCGVPGDVLEIRDGKLFVNGLEADGRLDLMHTYKIHRKDSGSIDYDPRQVYVIPPYTDTLYCALEDSYVQSKRLPCERYLLPPGLRDEAIFQLFKRNWNRDNFGPVKVPESHFFVLGDNRGISRDSRTLGFIEQSKFIGSVLWK